jgi:hypothetical protein
MKNQVSRMTKISGGILISILSIQFIVYSTLIVLILIYGLDIVKGLISLNSEQSYLGTFFILIEVLFAVMIVTDTIFTFIYLVVNSIYYSKCLKGKIAKPMMIINIVFAAFLLINIVPAFFSLIAVFNIFTLILVFAECLVVASILVYSILALVDSNKYVMAKN